MRAEFSAGRTEWEAAPTPSAAAELERAGWPVWEAGLLARRGIDTPERAEAFLAPSLDQLHDPLGLAGMPQAVERLAAAAAAGERVAIVGDYDVDGISGTALLSAVLEACGVEVEAILPHRLAEGYGFQSLHVERARQAGCRLVVTVDCGTTSHDAVEAARQADIDVIVTDHHLPERTPPAAILVNPKQEDCGYPFDELSGAGLAFKLAAAVAERLGRPLDPRRLLRVACLGTICDLVPLVGENRVIAALGLAALPESPSPGLRALIRTAGVRPPISAGDVGFRLGPRLNAAGRMADPDPALELLLTRDPRRAGELAEALDRQNRERQAAEREVVEAAREVFLAREELPRFLMAWDASWPRGVLGIAAGRLAKELHRPTLLLAVDGERAVGSGRSVPGIHIFRFLAGRRDELERFGGHAQAVGLTVATAALRTLRSAWEEAGKSWDDGLLVRRHRYDALLAAGDVGRETLERIGRLAPFGVGNPRPLFRLGPLRPLKPPRFFGQGHVGLRVADDGGEEVELVGWGWGERARELSDRFEVLGRMKHDRYLDRAVLELVDARPADAGDAAGVESG